MFELIAYFITYKAPVRRMELFLQTYEIKAGGREHDTLALDSLLKRKD